LNIQFWTHIPSPHQAAYIREVAKSHAVTVIADQRINAEREALGWVKPDLGRAEVVVASNSSLALALAHAGGDPIQLLSGYRGCAMSSLVLRAAAHNARIGILAEAGDFRGISGVLRKARCCWDVARNRPRVDFVLAMGSLGETWWAGSGFRGDRIFPFGYVVEAPRTIQAPSMRAESPFRLMFLGRLVECKGLELLLSALALCKRQAWQAAFVGSGPLESSCRKRAAHTGIAGRIAFVPSLPYDEAMKLLAQADLLVLPSRYDGWGAVVNEALMRGVPVICSSACGASDLIQYPWLGSVVAANSAERLRQALSEWIGRGPRTPELSDRIRTWSHCIGGPSMASYFLRVLECVYEGGPRPVAPWRVPSFKTKESRQHCIYADLPIGV
jgi:glycosyltransferase involved in cell wall biosynthesis